MRKSLLLICLAALFLSGCSASAATPHPSPIPTLTAQPPPTATAKAEPEGVIVPEMILEIKNESDPLNTPYGLALDSSGKIYVNDAGNSRVLVFDNAGTLLTKWDKKGSGEGEFN